jgi:menaquinone-specific isochorismate synthase
MLDRPPIGFDLHHDLSRQIQSVYHRRLRQSTPAACGKIVRIEIEIDSIDPLQWLARQSAAVATYWADRSGREIVAGVGEASVVTGDGDRDYPDILSEVRARLSPADPQVRYYGGVRFDRHLPLIGSWQKFGNYYFIVPRFELINRDRKTYFAVNYLNDNTIDPFDRLTAILVELDRLELAIEPQTHPTDLPTVIERQDSPDRQTWLQNVDIAIAELDRANITKVVLARRSQFTLSESISADRLLLALQPHNPHSYHFCFQLSPDLAFLGTSPERLYQRRGRSIETEAIAGTRPRGKSIHTDLQLALELQNSAKDVREHQLVVETIHRLLDRACDNVTVDRHLPILKLNKVQHLYCRFQGWLHGDISDGDLLSLLHPTPAVGGLPTAAALDLIRKLEAGDRGYYAAPVGWIEWDNSEFVVAIRSGIIDRQQLSLFAGAGIVPGSNSSEEWAEVETKISHFTDLFATRSLEGVRV